jgi:hypothetical protein
MLFKSLVFVGKKYISTKKFSTKTSLAIKLLHKFKSFIVSQKENIPRVIVLVDGGYTNQFTMNAIVQTGMKGFIGRYSKGRKIFLNNQEILLNDYIAGLSLKDFNRIDCDGSKKLIHTISCGVTGAESTKMVLVIDDAENPDLADIRPLVTNVLELNSLEIVTFYSRRWKQETYHQILKDGFCSRTHKLRSLKATMRYMELIAVAYSSCEIRRIKKGLSSIFEVKNELISIVNKNYILCSKGNKIKKSKQAKLLYRYVA